MPNRVSTPLPSSDRLLQSVAYCPASGNAYWKRRPDGHFKAKWIADNWNARYAGKKIQGKNADGYVKVMVDKKLYSLHRIAYGMLVGSIEDGMTIDHINGNRSDNRLANLRKVTVSDNAKNRGISRRNKTGRTGVYYLKKRRKYSALIRLDGRLKHIGHYDSFDDAVSARLSAEAIHFGNLSRNIGTHG